MALMPAPKSKPAIGLPGQFQNMEEWNAFTAFVTGSATKAIGFGHPVSSAGTAGDGTALVKALETGERFIGITRENITTGNLADQTLYADNDCIGVADEGVILVLAGGTITKGQSVFFNPTNNKYYGASAAGYLPLAGCEFDGPAVADAVAPLRLRIVPGGANVTAAT